MVPKHDKILFFNTFKSYWIGRLPAAKFCGWNALVPLLTVNPLLLAEEVLENSSELCPIGSSGAIYERKTILKWSMIKKNVT